MNCERIKHGEDVYLKLSLVEFKQKNASFYLAKITAADFLKIFTVRPAEYDLEKHIALANSFPDEKAYYTHLVEEDRKRINKKDFQRDPDTSRISKIKNFVETEEYALFPNTIISNCELINEFEDYPIDEFSTEQEFLALKNKPNNASFLRRTETECFLYVPDKPNTVLVIDGQHRLEGLKKSSLEVQAKYDLIIAFIIGFDRSIIAKQFYTINYEQKSVNKSLLYQLTGEFSHELDELTFLHNFVKLLNELADSPFLGRIKMLGKTPKNATVVEKEKLSISQAFLIDSSLRLISKNAVGTIMPPIFLKYYQAKEDHTKIIRAFARYFAAVSLIKEDWNSPKTSVLSKGMGVTALIRVLNLIFPKIFYVEMNGDWSKISNLNVADFQRILQGLDKVDFSTDGPYGKTGSGGSIAKMKNDILSNLEYIGSPKDLKAFETKLGIEYTAKFNIELSKISQQEL